MNQLHHHCLLAQRIDVLVIAALLTWWSQYLWFSQDCIQKFNWNWEFLQFLLIAKAFWSWVLILIFLLLVLGICELLLIEDIQIILETQVLWLDNLQLAFRQICWVILHDQNLLSAISHHREDPFLFFTPLKSPMKPFLVHKTHHLHILSLLLCHLLALLGSFSSSIDISFVVDDNSWSMWHHSHVFTSSDKTHYDFQFDWEVLFIATEVIWLKELWNCTFDLRSPDVVSSSSLVIDFIDESQCLDDVAADSKWAFAFKAAFAPHFWSDAV